MSWRLSTRDFNKQKGEANKRAMKRLVYKKRTTGIIAYMEREPVGWCSVAPRRDFLKLENSRVLKRIDDQTVWSVTCLFISKKFRRMGISTDVLKGAIEFCRKKGVKIIEAYPIIPYSRDMPAAFAWTGILSAYEKAGFREAKRPSKSRPIMRYYL